MSHEDAQLIAEFVVESREHLADIENQLLAIERAGPDADVDLVNTVFRAVHSVKGAAGFLGFTVLGKLAHHLENVLNLVRSRELVLNASNTDILLRAADQLRVMLDDIHNSNEVNVDQQIEALQRVVSGSPVEATPVAAAPVVEAPAQPTCPVEVEPMAELPPPLPQVAPSIPPVEPAPAAEPPRGSKPVQEAAANAAAETNIRVAVNVLDRLMNLAGELVLARNQFLQAISSGDSSNLGPVASRINQVTSELQETIMQTRLQTVGTVFNRFPRVVRDISNSLGKHCQLVMEGQEVELDKSIIEAITDPLTHLIRNAVDHGVEKPDARVATGKSPHGTVVLRAYHQAGKVIIAISDDGRGIDAAKLKQKAVAAGVISAEQASQMNDREALNLIFKAGFSTAERVTEISGRGVGMDVVRTNIERIGGTVNVETQMGRGTTISVKLPLTLAIIPSLIVRCGDRRFAVPQSSISELVRIKPQESATRIQRVKHAEVLRLRGSLLPLVRLDEALGLGDHRAEQAAVASNIIVVESGNLRYGLVVDGLHDSEEIVVKPLGKHMKQCVCMAGATILGDGTVAFILDVAGIANHRRLAVADHDDTLRGTADDQFHGEDRQTLLLFCNDPSEHFAIPMQLVARLERIRGDQIDTVGGHKVLQYRGRSLPLLELSDYIAAKPRPDSNWVHVVVFTAGGREIGLVVRELIDVQETAIEIDSVILRQPGIIGSMVLDQKTIRLLDPFELAQTAHPDWFQNQPPTSQATGKAPVLLLAEDSDFFRKQMKQLLEDAGYRVLDCEDGQAAYEALLTHDDVDLIVTDLEMPRMDGFELTRRVKELPHLAHLPILAVTSLASDEDRERGFKAGIDDYHIKLDRERLVAAIGTHLKRVRQTAAR